MKREDVLLYIINDQIYLYFINKKREFIEKLDTSSFFKWGEICCVENGISIISAFLNTQKILTGIFKPNLIVLYNDITNSDIIFLYKNILLPFNYNDINFYPITSIIKKMSNKENIVLFDKNYYTIFKSKTKQENVPKDFNPIFIGKKDKKYIYYSDKDILWKLFKSHFTKE